MRPLSLLIFLAGITGLHANTTVYEFVNDEPVITLTFAGDIMAHDINFKTKPLSSIYAGVSETLKNDDLSFGNLEFPVDPQKPYTSYPSFNVQPEYVEEAIKAGFDVFSLANNHTNDRGYASVVRTYNSLQKLKDRYPIYHSGIYFKERELSVVEIKKKGLKIGFLAVSQFMNNNVSVKGRDMVYIFDYNKPADVNKLEEFITSESGKYDCFILSYHGGREYVPQPSAAKKRFYTRMLKAGVDILWGHHPHVLQPWYQTAGEEGDKLALYSLGNFISGQLTIVDPLKTEDNFSSTGFSSLFQVKIKKRKEGGVHIVETNPLIIGNVRNEKRMMVVEFPEDVYKREMPEEWMNFYRVLFAESEKRMKGLPPETQEASQP